MDRGRMTLRPPEVLRPGEIPVVSVFGRNISEVWERTVLKVWEKGTHIPTEYDQEIDPESRDATAVITVADPLSEPRIHLAGLPTGLDELFVYTQEVVNGVHDSWVKEGGWSYSYHERLCSWPGSFAREAVREKTGVEFEIRPVDQIEAMITKLVEAPHSRRAQATTWLPPFDSEHHEPPCLQRIWCRIVKSEGGVFLLQMNTHWRSRDILKAAFMNMYALTEWQKLMAEEISRRSGLRVEPGRYVDISDSAHIYGSYVRLEEIGRFLKSLTVRDFSSRTRHSDDPQVLQEFNRGKERLSEEKK